jgi:hypothetical protein
MGTSFWYKDCEVMLWLEECFRIYNTEASFQKLQGKILKIYSFQLSNKLFIIP